MSKNYRFTELQVKDMLGQAFKAGYETSMDFKEQEIDHILSNYTNIAASSDISDDSECDPKTAEIKKTLRSIIEVMKKQEAAKKSESMASAADG